MTTKDDEFEKARTDYKVAKMDFNDIKIKPRRRIGIAGKEKIFLQSLDILFKDDDNSRLLLTVRFSDLSKITKKLNDFLSNHREQE